MKHIRKWLIRIGIVLLVIVIVLASVGTWFVRRPWPQVSGTIKVAGLQAPVQVIRDKWGVPNIYAQNEHDLFFAQGYVHAQDRLWQMEVDRRFGSGTLSEVLGQQVLDLDRFMHTVGLRRIAEQTWSQSDGDSRAILEAYAAGVNTYVDTHRDRLPIEFAILGVNPAPWTPTDTLMEGNLLALNEGLNFRYELWRAMFTAELGEQTAQQLFPRGWKDTPTIITDTPTSSNWLSPVRLAGIASMDAWPSGLSGNRASDNLVIHNSRIPFSMSVPPTVDSDSWSPSTYFAQTAVLDELWGALSESGGSNSWAISGDRIQTGMPILANDPHLPLSMAFSFYENGLHGGRFDIAGFTFPGVPLVILGHNQRIAWGITNMNADVQDAYIEKLDSTENPTQYEFEGKWYKLDVISETIKVKGSAPVAINILRTRHGPIVSNVLQGAFWLEPATSPKGTTIALRWTPDEGSNVFKAIVQLNLAGNWDEFRAALHNWDALSENFVFADVAGNIGYQAAGRVPIRLPADLGIVPEPGWTGEYEWQGFIPFDQLPSVLNPSTGYVVTANNKVAPDSYPYLLAYDLYDPGYRAKRITDLLSTNDHMTIQDVQRIQGDTYSIPAGILRPYLLAVKPENSLQAKALDYVRTWDLYYTTDSIGASIYDTWYKFLVEDLVAQKYGEARLSLLDYWPVTRLLLMITQVLSDPHNPWCSTADTPQIKTCDAIVRQSFSEAVDWLSKQYGQDPNGWQWGRINLTFVSHVPLGGTGIGLVDNLFNTKHIPVPGNLYAVNTSWNPPIGGTYGAQLRMIVDTSNWDNSLSVITPGQNQQLFQPNREDQMSLWQNAQYHSMPFSRSAVDKNAAATLTLAP